MARTFRHDITGGVEGYRQTNTVHITPSRDWCLGCSRAW